MGTDKQRKNKDGVKKNLRRGVFKSECEQPVEASSDTCTMEQAKALDKACGLRLAKDCAEAGMGFVKEGDITSKDDGTVKHKDGIEKPVSGVFKSECEQPVQASRDTCTMEQAK